MMIIKAYGVTLTKQYLVSYFRRILRREKSEMGGVFCLIEFAAMGNVSDCCVSIGGVELACHAACFKGMTRIDVQYSFVILMEV